MESVLVDSRLLFRQAPTISFALLTLTRIATGVPINMLAAAEVCDANHRQAEERWPQVNSIVYQAQTLLPAMRVVFCECKQGPSRSRY